MEVFQQHPNTFSKGLNVDLDPNILDPEQYIDAANVTLVPSGKFLALQNIKGTTNVQSLGITNSFVLGVFATRYTIGTVTDIPCLTIITATSAGNIKVYCYDPANTAGVTLYTLYQASTPSDYFTVGQGMVDGVLYPEKGFDILYVTDNYYEPRKIRCNIQAPNIASNSPFLTDASMAIARRKAIGNVQFVSTSIGGTLLTGTYQVAYQLINLNTNQVGAYNKYTRFSLLTTPIHVYYNATNNPYALSSRSAGVGMVSNQQININIVPTSDELANYTHFRLAVVENVGPEGAVALSAAVTEIQPISTYLQSGVITGYSIKTNYQNNSVTLDEIVIDTAAIDHVKTINVKNNRLFLGNINYKNLTYNNGTPSITSGSILQKTTTNAGVNNDSFNEQDFSTSFKGYFRNEVYRYAISYFDKYGNFSSPSWLDMTAVTGNQSTGYLKSSHVITNSSFSSGSLSGWSQTGAGTAWAYGVCNDGISGAHTALPQAGGTSAILYQALTYTAGTVYNLGYSFTLIPTPSGMNATIEVVYLNGTTVISAQTIFSGSTAFTNTFAGTFTLTVPPTTTNIGIRNTVTAVGSPPTQDIRLNLFDVSANTGFDMKFPARSQKIGGVTYGLFNTNGATQSLGLQLNGLNNHPTWAQGFVILRVPRKKNILFQTPLVPMCNVYGLGPLDNYPVIAQEGITPANVVYTSGTSTANATGLQASPAGPVNVLYPMNLFWPKKRSIVKIVADSAGGLGLNGYRAGEAQLINDPPLTHAQIFPPGLLYTQNHPYVFATSHQVETVDAAILTIDKLNTFGTNANGATTWSNGSGDTSCSGTFSALLDSAYYYDSGNSGAKAALRSTVNTIGGYLPFANGSPGSTLDGKFIMTVDNLETKGVTFGWKPIVQKSAVIELANSVTSINDTGGLTFAIGAPVAKAANPYTDFGTLNQKINTIEIANITAGLNDSRYGAITAFNNYIFTGAQYNFTDAELATVAAGGSLPKNITVWGGDCFVGAFNFKTSDTAYTVVNQDKYLAVPAGKTSAVVVASFGRDWLNSNGPAVISLPVALRNASQYLTVVLESEYNGSVQDFDTADISPVNGFNEYYAASEPKCRSPLAYAYNYNLNKENDQKIFVPIDPLNPVLTTLKSRIVYSNVKVYNTSTDGFDTIPVLNFFDLPETYGSLTKLAIEANNMYSIQQRGIAYLPVGQRVIETSDASNLQVHSGDILNVPVWIDIKRGGQHLQGIKETGTSIYIMDNENQAIYNLVNQQLTHISDKGLMSTARTIFNNGGLEFFFKIVHDILRNEIWFTSQGSFGSPFCYVWNENLSAWVSRYNFDVNNLAGGVFTNNTLYIVGQGVDNNQVSIHTMYTGNFTQLMGTYINPSVTFIANPNPNFGKTFDDVLLNSTDRLKQLTTIVSREAALGNQTATVLTLTSVGTRGEGNYRAKILRDNSSGARLRGGKATHALQWDTGSSSIAVTLTSVITQWRPSFKQF